MAATPQAGLTPSSPTATAQFDRSGRHLTAYVAGELDAASVPAIADAISDRINPDDDQVWIDMSATTFCDSSGVMMVFRLHCQVDASGGRLGIYNPSPMVRRILDICDPDHVIAVRT